MWLDAIADHPEWETDPRIVAHFKSVLAEEGCSVCILEGGPSKTRIKRSITS